MAEKPTAFRITTIAIELSPNSKICILVSRIHSEYMSLPVQTLYNVSNRRLKDGTDEFVLWQMFTAFSVLALVYDPQE